MSFQHISPGEGTSASHELLQIVDSIGKQGLQAARALSLEGLLGLTSVLIMTASFELCQPVISRASKLRNDYHCSGRSFIMAQLTPNPHGLYRTTPRIYWNNDIHHLVSHQWTAKAVTETLCMTPITKHFSSKIIRPTQTVHTQSPLEGRRSSGAVQKKQVSISKSTPCLWPQNSRSSSKLF